MLCLKHALFLMANAVPSVLLCIWSHGQEAARIDPPVRDDGKIGQYARLQMEANGALSVSQKTPHEICKFTTRHCGLETSAVQ